MERYQFERIYAQMAKEYGKMPDSETGEGQNAMLLFPMEGNALRIHRAYPKSNSYRMREAIGLVLYDILGRNTGKTYDVEKFRDEDNARLEKALLMAFDPFTNEKIMNMIGPEFDPNDLHHYYKQPVRCLLRIKDSVDLWEGNGPDGYFTFIENYMGENIKGTEMQYTVVADASCGRIFKKVNSQPNTRYYKSSNPKN